MTRPPGAGGDTTSAGAVTVEVHDRIAVVTLDNPRTHNSITRFMRHRLDEVFTDIADSDVAAVVLTGRGRSFSSGMDIGEITPDGAHRVADELVAVERRIAEAAVPTIAAVDGNCVGGGAQLAFACDLRVAAERSSFAITPAKLGIVYPAASVIRLVRVVGPAVAKLLLFTADPVDARSALRYGMVHQVVRHDDVRSTALGLARTIAGRSAVSVRAAKSVVDAATVSADAAVDAQERWRRMDNPDIADALSAFGRKDFRTPASAP
ncbi:enoyl-CoA hydratase/isomerase family protein [Prescottella sp. R16]|uniref:enoyl-CoA hydratase/isomerase family protein n=1 Tax=Prescottella sp. R16 TaxID=3064529 RepID=UPI00272E24DC|nr:enoyl-CoA hydratase/isomerase family protein [Prescottella sp. R16]